MIRKQEIAGRAASLAALLMAALTTTTGATAGRAEGSGPKPSMRPIAASLAKGWHRARLASANRVTMGQSVQVVAGRSGLVAVTGTDPYDSPPAPLAIWRSADGRVWKSVTVDPAVFPPTTDISISDIIAAGPGFIAIGGIGDRGAVWASTDGSVWAEISQVNLSSIAVGGPGYIGAGAGTLWTSPDAIVWQPVPGGSNLYGGSSVTSIAATPHGFVAVGTRESTSNAAEDYGALWISSDGLNWQRVPGEASVFGVGTTVYQVVSGSDGLVVIGYDWREGQSAIWASPDRQTWQRVTSIPATGASVTSIGTRFVAVSHERIAQVGTRLNYTEVPENPELWSSGDGFAWKKEGSTDAFGMGNCSISSIAPYGDGLAAAGTCEAPPDLTPFIATWLWTPRSSQTAPPKKLSLGDPKRFALQPSDLPPGIEGSEEYISVADTHIAQALTPHAAYSFRFSTPAGQGINSVSIVAHGDAQAQAAFALGNRFFLYSAYDSQCQAIGVKKPRLLPGSGSVGQESKVFATNAVECDTSESDTFGQSTRYPSAGVVWRDGRFLGVVQVIGSQSARIAKLSRIALLYARKQWKHLKVGG